MSDKPKNPKDQKPANQTDVAPGSVKQRGGHNPKGDDLPRGSETDTRRG